jgi:hypothetical protein
MRSDTFGLCKEEYLNEAAHLISIRLFMDMAEISEESCDAQPEREKAPSFD